jgi:hypothetical protein
MPGNETQYTEALVRVTEDKKKCFVAFLTESGQEETMNLGAVCHVSDPEAHLADYWTPERLEQLPSDRHYSDAVLIGEMLVFVGGLERLVFLSELGRGTIGASPFGGLLVGEALAFIDQSADCASLAFPVLNGFKLFGRSYAW